VPSVAWCSKTRLDKRVSGSRLLIGAGRCAARGVSMASESRSISLINANGPLKSTRLKVSEVSASALLAGDSSVPVG
jgi:hypothetical protein